MALAFGIEDNDGGVLAIYVHSNGIAEHAIDTVSRHYCTWESAKSLISLGCLSWVGVSIGDRVDFDDAQKAMVYAVPSQCLAYARDRGEPWEQNAPQVFQSREQFRCKFSWKGIERYYLFDRKAGCWLFHSCPKWKPVPHRRRATA